MDNERAPGALGSNDVLGQFESWWRDNWPEATPQSASFGEGERCTKLAWAAAVAAERERCAKVCESLPTLGNTDTEAMRYSQAQDDCAAAIRGA